MNKKAKRIYKQRFTVEVSVRSTALVFIDAETAEEACALAQEAVDQANKDGIGLSDLSWWYTYSAPEISEKFEDVDGTQPSRPSLKDVVSPIAIPWKIIKPNRVNPYATFDGENIWIIPKKTPKKTTENNEQ
jgi:hypothetical protein